MPADTIVRAQLSAVGGEQMLTVLRAVRQEIVGVGQQRARVTVDADTAQARQSIALIRQETAELRAAKYGLTITADTAQANRSLQQITLETQRINAIVARARVDIDTSAAERKIDGLSDKLTDWARRGAALFAGAALAKGVASIGDALLGMNSRLEQSALSFNVLTGSADTANKLLADLENVAAHSTFGLAQLQAGAQQLLAFGLSAKDVVPTITAVGTAAAASGGDIQDKFQRIAYVIAELSSGLKLSERQIRELAMAGVPLRDLAATIGVTVETLNQAGTTGEVTSAQVVAAFQKMYSEGKYGDFMQRQAETAAGAFAIFKTNAALAAADGLHPLFVEFESLAKSAAQFTQSAAFHEDMAKVSEIATILAHDLQTVVTGAETAATAISKVPTPVIAAAIHIAELAVAVKAAEVAFGLVRTVLAPTIALLGSETEATTANTIAIAANTAAANTNAVAKERMGGAGAAGAETAMAGTATRGAGVAALGVSALESGGIIVAIAEGWREGTKVLPDILRGDFAQALKDVTLNAPGLPQTLYRIGQDTGHIGTPAGNLGTAAFDTGSLPQGVLPGPLQGISEQGGNVVVAQMLAQVAAGTMSADAATAAFDRLGDSFGGMLHNADDLRKQFEDGLTPAINAYADSLGDAADAQAKASSQMAQATHALAAGASSEDISRAIFGKTGAGTTATQEQIKAAQDAIAPLVAAYEAQQQAVLAKARQFGQDLQQATAQAAQAIQAVDLSKGLASIAAAAPGLDKARDALHNLGQESSSLNALAALADEWKAITDATDKASASFRGYLQLTSETDQRIQQLQALKKQYDDAADAADAARKKGQPLSADQRTLLDNRPAVDANIQAQIDKLHATGQAGDLNAAVKVVPDFAAFDQQMRDKVRAAGGAASLDVTVKALTTQAEAEVKGFLDKPRQLVVNAVLNTDGLPAWAKNLLVNAAGGGTSGSTSGAYTTAGGRDLSRFNQGEGGDTGMARFTGGNSAFSYADYSRVVGDAPIAGDANYRTLLEVAQQMGVDARQLLAVMQTESDFGRTAGKIGQQYNYGGMGINDRGYGHDSGIHATDGGPEYAGYNNYADFLKDLAAWIKQNGGNFSNYQTADQGQAKGNAYQRLQQELPQTGGAASGGHAAQGAPDLTGTVANVRQQIVQKAMQSLDTDTLAGYCEQFVEQTVEAITGRRGATGNREATAASALQNALSQGLGITQAQAQPGDLVYYGNAAGGTGHVAIYMGNNQQISTEDVGGSKVHIEGILPGAQFVRVPGVPDFAPGGAPPSAGNRAPDSRFDAGQQGTLNLADPNTDAARAAAAQFRKEQADLKDSVLATKAAQDEFNKSLQGLSTANLKDAVTQYGAMAGYFQKLETAKLPDNADEVQKQAAVNLAFADTLNFGAAYDHLLKDIQNHTGDVAADTERLAAIVGGPLAQSYAQAAQASAQITAAQATIKDLQAQQQQADQAHSAVVQQRAAADQAESRSQTEAQWAQQASDTARQRAETASQQRVADQREAITRQQQDAAYAEQQQQTARAAAHDQEMRGIQDRTQAENDSYTQISRQQQDKTRYLQFYGSEQKRILSDSLFDQQEAFTKSRAGENSQSQLLTAQAKGASTNAGAESFASQNAILKDTMATEDDALKKAEENNKHLQMLEDRKAAQESYDLETQTIAQQRAHEDALAALAKQTTATDRSYQDQQAAIAATDALRAHSEMLQQRQWADEDKAHQRAFEADSNRIADLEAQRTIAHQRALWRIEDQRQAEDATYESAKAANTAMQAEQQAIVTSAQASLDAAQQALAAWQQTGQVIASAAATTASALAAAGGSVTGIPGSGRRLGAYAAGGTIGMGDEGIVGDAPGGGITPYTERITVTPQGAIVTPLRDLSAQNGGTAHPTLSPTYNITIVQQPGEDAAALWARLKPMLDAYQLTQSVATLHAATGGAR